MTTFDFGRLDWDVVGLAAGLAAAGVQKLWRGYRERRSDTWPISYGTIDRVDVVSEQKKNKVKFFYRYRVGSESFTGSYEKSFDDTDDGVAWAKALDRKQVPVRYDPANPSRSQLREVELEPMVQAASPPRPVSTEESEAFGWKRAVAAAVLLVSVMGFAITLAMLIEEHSGNVLVPPSYARASSIGMFVLFGMAAWLRNSSKRKLARPPTWMKYLGYALFYYAAFMTFVPSPGIQRRQNPAAHKRHDGRFDARYQLFLYFSTIELCYTAVKRREEHFQSVGAFDSSNTMDHVTHS